MTDPVPQTNQNACLFAPTPVVQQNRQALPATNENNFNQAYMFTRTLLNAGSPASPQFFPFTEGQNDGKFTGNSFPVSLNESLHINSAISPNEIFQAFGTVEPAINSMYIPPGTQVTLNLREVVAGQCSTFSANTVTIRGGLSGSVVSNFQHDTRLGNSVVTVSDQATVRVGSSEELKTCTISAWNPQPKYCLKSATFQYDPEYVRNGNFNDFLIEYGCLGTTATNTITVNNEFLPQYRAGQEPCDTLVRDWCQRTENNTKPECACFREEELLQQQFPDFPVPLVPACFGGCGQTRAYKTAEFASAQCDQTICSQIVEEIGNSIADNSTQELVCDNTVYIINQDIATTTPIPNPNPNLGSPVNDNTLYLIVAMGSLFFVVLIIFLALFIRRKLQTGT